MPNAGGAHPREGDRVLTDDEHPEDLEGGRAAGPAARTPAGDVDFCAGSKSTSPPSTDPTIVPHERPRDPTVRIEVHLDAALEVERKLPGSMVLDDVDVEARTAGRPVRSLPPPTVRQGP
jgi:hypothetical protein